MKTNKRIIYSLVVVIMTAGSLLFIGCGDYYKNDYRDNSPTSGKLKVYCNEGLYLHCKNQAYTFCSQYHNAAIETYSCSETEAIQALYQDSCQAIMVSRLLGEQEKKMFEQKQLFPKFSPVAKTGVVFIASRKLAIDKLTVDQIKELLSGKTELQDTSGKTIKVSVVLDHKNSSSSHFLLDSVLGQAQFGTGCFALNNTLELIRSVSENDHQIGIIDFAWLSDVDDPLFKSYIKTIKFLAIGKNEKTCVEPSQSTFKTEEYPFTRTVYILRRSDDFSLAKGFEAFVAGPKGQLIFLKQGLLPNRQAERTIEVNMEPVN